MSAIFGDWEGSPYANISISSGWLQLLHWVSSECAEIHRKTLFSSRLPPCCSKGNENQSVSLDCTINVNDLPHLQNSFHTYTDLLMNYAFGEDWRGMILAFRINELRLEIASISWFTEAKNPTFFLFRRASPLSMIPSLFIPHSTCSIVSR